MASRAIEMTRVTSGGAAGGTAEVPPHRRYGRYRYGPWQGGPDPLAPPYDVRQALDALGEEVLAGSGLREALREMLRRGLPDEHGNLNRQGLDDLRARAMRMRREV